MFGFAKTVREPDRKDVELAEKRLNEAVAHTVDASERFHVVADERIKQSKESRDALWELARGMREPKQMRH